MKGILLNFYTKKLRNESKAYKWRQMDLTLKFWKYEILPMLNIYINFKGFLQIKLMSSTHHGLTC